MKTWKITQLQTYPQAEGETNFVCSAAWNVSETVNAYTGSLSGSTAFKLDPAAPFTPYDELTETQVLDWVFASIGEDGKASAEADVDAQIVYAQEQVQTPAMPWSA